MKKMCYLKRKKYLYIWTTVCHYVYLNLSTWTILPVVTNADLIELSLRDVIFEIFILFTLCVIFS